ncbi:hypothetical protein NCLIV_052370 [Neospora caninum Liverpool]|uniref:Aquaporin 1 n=1 Tax=Neospora caninum (strain Liverpool) TaxID=572307 RepID=F0VL59_NEOCL|nr:hypothetical protein NCLIV_052370 [Neospora caninum Liverpool]CBZ54811.1 hypothetical protein NCLIV_052370 [Neospora caninum Liverpool]CEL69530.1 TPA: aquaporin 1 [Neospora caninum Liverpool]|eukprot:XP_003884839.1 hypothetical protein NCLIV_052370 [Neospora caninum Liverpool]
MAAATDDRTSISKDVHDEKVGGDLEAGAGPLGLKPEESNLMPGVSPSHTVRGFPGQGFAQGRTSSTAAVLSRRMESNTFIGRVHPSMQQFAPVRGAGDIHLRTPLSDEMGRSAHLAHALGLEEDDQLRHVDRSQKAGSEGGGESGVEPERDYLTPELGRFERFIFNMQKYLCEFFAAMVIVTAVAFGLAKEGGAQAAPLSITSTIFALITLFKDISGAHFNPAVSCTIYLTDPRFTLLDLVSYIAAQLIGGTVGAFVGYGIMGKALDILPLDPGMSAGRQLFHEVIPTMVMIYAVLVLVFGYGVMWELTVPFVVSACVLAGALAGATMNPAVTFGIFISNICTANSNIDVGALLVTLFGPFLGAMFAFVGYVATHAYHNPIPLRFLNFKGL